MALINKSESEKLYNYLIREIRTCNTLTSSEKDIFINYLVDIKKGIQKNEFIDDEILASVMAFTAKPSFPGSRDYLSDQAKFIRHVLPYGDKTEDYEQIKEELLTHYVGENGIQTKGLISEEFCSVFKNKRDYFEIMNIIRNDKDVAEHFDEIVEFSIRMGREIKDSDQLKREILAFVHDVPYRIEDKDAYLEDRINTIRKQYGIYPGLDEESLANVSREADKAKYVLAKLKNIDKKIDNHNKSIDDKMTAVRQELLDAIENAKFESKQELDAYLDELEETMKLNSEATFQEILAAATEKIREIRVATNSLGSNISKELIKFRTEAEKHLGTRKVEGEQTSQAAPAEGGLPYPNGNDDIINRIFTISSDTPVKAQGTGSTQGTLVTSPAIIVDSDADEFLVPEYTMTEGFLPAFDPSIKFVKRLRLVEENIKKMESDGYLIPDTIYEALPWYIQGNKIIYIYGPAQSGKTTLAELLAKAVGTELIDGGKITEEHSVTSFNDVRGKFDENQLYYGLYYGKTVLYDEFDNDNPNNLVLLGTYMSKLSSKIRYPEKDIRATFAKRRSVPINPNARIITTGNTNGKGRNKEYTERKRFDESTHQRIVPFYVGYNAPLEAKIFAGKQEWYDFFNYFRGSCEGYFESISEQEVEGNLTTNDARTLVDIIEDDSMPVSSIMRGLFVQIKDDNYLQHLITDVVNHYKISDDDNIDIEALNDIPLKDLNKAQIASAFVYEAKHKNKGYVKKRSHE